MPNTTIYSFADVVRVPFPFTNQSTTKKRPAVVVSSAAYNEQRPDIILMAITSQFRPTNTVGEVGVPHDDGRTALRRALGEMIVPVR